MFERPPIDNRLQPPTEPGSYESGLRRPAPDEEAARYLAAIALVVPEYTRVIDPNMDVRKLFQHPAELPQQQHLDRLAYAQQVLAELDMPIAEGSVEGLSLRYGRSTFGATLVDGRNVVVRTHSGAFIGEDPNTKYINGRIPTQSSFHEYVMAYVTKSKSILAAGTKYPDLFPINYSWSTAQGYSSTTKPYIARYRPTLYMVTHSLPTFSPTMVLSTPAISAREVHSWIG